MDGLVILSTLLTILALRTTTVAGGVCVNALQGGQCEQKAARGECTTKRKYMAANCAKACEECGSANCGPMEIALVVDSSVSIRRKGHENTKESIIALLQSFTMGRNETRVSLIQFGRGVYSSDVITFDRYGDDWENFKHKILNLKWQKGPRTDTGDGIRYMVNQLMSQARNVSTRIAVVITDGQSQDYRNTAREAAKAKEAGIAMFSVGVGRHIKQRELLTIASDDRKVFQAGSYGDLAVVMKEVQETICKSSGSRCRVDADLMFVVDTSDSIGLAPFKKGVKFLADFVRGFDIVKNNIRVAFILYSSSVLRSNTIGFDKPAEELYTAIENLPWRRGGTRTDLALNALVTDFLPQLREGVSHIAFIVSDGDSNYEYATRRSAANAREHNITLVAVGIGSKIHGDELTNIAGSGGTAVRAKDYDHLQDVRDLLVEAACTG